MKQYPKKYPGFFNVGDNSLFVTKTAAYNGNTELLVKRFRDFYHDIYGDLFMGVVKHIWLEKQMAYDGIRRTGRSRNGRGADKGFGHFMRSRVGISHRVLTRGTFFSAVGTYLLDFYPDFLKHDPFIEPEYYKFPYEHVTIDFLCFVFQMDNRLEILAEAEKRGMLFSEFTDWVVNWALCYNDDINDDKYSMIADSRLDFNYVRNNDLPVDWTESKMKF